MSSDFPQSSNHFKDKDAISHVVEAQAAGIIAAAEIHGTEIPGHISSAADASRETAVVLLLLSLVLSQFHVEFQVVLFELLIFSCGWLAWKTGRSAWLGWSRLERLHRIVAEERWEIENHRQQEREELKALYAVKGFEGKLLEDVLDVLMADGDRLLRVMVEEELGLSLEVHEHPLQQGLGAAVGVLSTTVLFALGGVIFSSLGLLIAAFCSVTIAALISALYEKNRMIPAVVWNLALIALAYGLVYFLLQISPL